MVYCLAIGALFTCVKKPLGSFFFLTLHKWSVDTVDSALCLFEFNQEKTVRYYSAGTETIRTSHTQEGRPQTVFS